LNNPFPGKNFLYLYNELHDRYEFATAEAFGGPQLDNFQKTAFNELTVAELNPKVQVYFPYGIISGQCTINNTSSGFTWWDSGMAHLSAPIPNSYSQLVTRRFIKTDPGVGCIGRYTAIFTSGRAQTKQIIGIGDRLDGFFFGYSGVDFGILKIRDGVEEWHFQPNWNVDTFNGTGKSLHKFYPESGNVYQVHYQWLGFGQISFYIENPRDGILTNIHNIKYANSNLAPSVMNPSLPMSAYVENSGNNSFTGTLLKTSSMGAFTEGKFNGNLGIRHASGSNAIVTTTELNNIFTIKNNTTFKNKSNRIEAETNLISISSNGNKSVCFIITRNSSVGTGTLYNYFDSGNSPISCFTGFTPVTGGEQISHIDLSQTDSEIIQESISLFPGELLSVSCAANSAGGSVVVNTSINWKEFF
jgi:hypothetical protein